MSKLKFISAQPDELYYAWQVEVMLDNFLSIGISGEDIHIVIGIQKNIGEWWYKMIEKYPSVGFYFYNDTRETKIYPPSIRPHILNKHWDRFAYLYNSPIFYHDCDMLFTRKPDFSKLIKGDTWYLSDAKSYIGYDYILSKGNDVFYKMLSILNLNQYVVRNNDKSAGGAQYLMKNVTSSFWKRVEDKSVELYDFFNSIDSDIQKWTSDMWALLWSAWYYKYDTKIDSYLNFSMATDTWPKWDKNLIYHNAGAVREHEGKLFIKDKFRGSLPYSDSTQYDSQFCSYRYHQQIIKTGENSCLKPKEIDMNVLLESVKSIFINT